ncbi:MAG: FeoB-associated Cys-rich membrane protein [Clostridia bacterium]|nr:FeoB-associated Cys-rich membrane protein [Clostridia bacterium]
MESIIIAIIILVIVGLAAAYIIKEKKAGKKCIGCPYSSECAAKGKCDCNK